MAQNDLVCAVLQSLFGQRDQFSFCGGRILPIVMTPPFDLLPWLTAVTVGLNPAYIHQRIWLGVRKPAFKDVG